MRLILNIRLDFHNFHKALETGDAFLKLFREVDQLFHGFRQIVDVKQIGQQIPQQDPFHRNERGPGQNDNDGDHRGKGIQSGVIIGHNSITVLAGFDIAVVLNIKFFHFTAFTGKRFDDTDSG